MKYVKTTIKQLKVVHIVKVLKVIIKEIKMYKLIMHISGKRILEINNKKFEIEKDVASFLAKHLQNIKIEYEV